MDKDQYWGYDTDTPIQICCSMKRGPLSTMSTLEALGLDIQQWVISYFNGGLFQSSYSKDHRSTMTTMNCDDLNQTIICLMHGSSDTNQETKHARYKG
ncbi:hypothetical protein HanPI659440_Chr12g0467261 [Helianthus annuus]|nr:hypothetical protein HanPI659440_Chr12g0467261 [Helianthus annuus]